MNIALQSLKEENDAEYARSRASFNLKSAISLASTDYTIEQRKLELNIRERESVDKRSSFEKMLLASKPSDKQANNEELEHLESLLA